MATPPSDLPEMEYRFVGRSGLQISAISIGGWLTFGGHVDEEKAHTILKAAYDVGINFFDFAEGYASGESELVFGRALKKYAWNRNDIVISTKINWGAATSARGPAYQRAVNNVGLSRKHVIEGTEAALKRLGVAYVDVVYAHRPDRLTPIEETVRAFNWLIENGRALYWGTSEWMASEIEEAWAVADRLGLIGPIVEQPGYSLLRREKVEEEFRNAGLYERRGLGLTVFSPLQGGVLTGKYVDGVPEDSRIAQSEDKYIQSVKAGVGNEAWKKQQESVKGLMKIAERLGTDVATLAMAWVLKNKDVSSAITGASRPEQIYQTVRAIDVAKKLDEAVLKEIDEVFGNRPAELQKRFG